MSESVDIDVIDVQGVRITEDNRYFVVYNSNYEVEVDPDQGQSIMQALSRMMQARFNAPLRSRWETRNAL